MDSAKSQAFRLDDNDILVAEHDVESYGISLTFYSYAHFVSHINFVL